MMDKVSGKITVDRKKRPWVFWKGTKCAPVQNGKIPNWKTEADCQPSQVRVALEKKESRERKQKTDP